MEISAQFIPGLKLGLEYTELDEDDQKTLDTEHSMVVSLDLAFLRILIWS